MIIIHLGEIDGALFLWGETSIDEALALTSGSTERHKRPARPHVFAAGSDRLVDALSLATDEFHVDMESLVDVAVWLPSRGRNPLPSNRVLGEPKASRAKLRIAKWSITAYRLSQEDSIDFLAACMGQRMLGAGVILGDDVQRWAEALRLAGSIVSRQQFLPSISIDERIYRGVWKPIFVGEDAETLVDIARRMPAVVHAMSYPEASKPPASNSIEALGNWVAEMTDYIVRTSASTKPLTAEIRGGDKAFKTVHDFWLDSLTSIDNAIYGPRRELRILARQVNEWRRPIAMHAKSPVRLCFRLEEPSGLDDEADGVRTDGDWYVRYMLQSYADPSLLVSATEAWLDKDEDILGLNRTDFNAREFLLASLGRAAAISSKVTDSLKMSDFEGHAVDTMQAHKFLVEESIALQHAGYGILLPAWWTRKGTKTKVRAHANVKTPLMQGSGISMESIVEFDWQLSLGEHDITLEELERLADLKMPLVKIRGQWVELNENEIRAAADFWKRTGTDTSTVKNMIRMALGIGEVPDGVEFAGVRSTGWVAQMINQLEEKAEFESIDTPNGFKGVLRPYQVRGYSWLSYLSKWRLGACLADDMGLGKTIQALALIQRDWIAGERNPVLLVCPTAVIYNWQRESSKFTPDLPIMIHHGMNRLQGEDFKAEAQNQALVISSYGLLQRDLETFRAVPWKGVVLDEAQKIKNPATKQSRAARAIEANFKIALTGTPVENNVGDLWSIMDFLNPGFLGSQSGFRDKYFKPIQMEHDRDAAERLRRITGPFILRRLKTDKSIISDLPEKQEMKEYCSLTREQASLYAAVLNDMENEIEGAEGIGRKGLVLGTLSKLKQVCNHPAQFLGDNSSIGNRSGKMARLIDILDEIFQSGDGDKILIFSQFVEMGEIIRRHAQEMFGQEVLFLHGGVPRRKQSQMIDRFQNEKEPRAFILSLRAGGTGINLPAANHVIHFDRWWNPAVENQATDRAYRIGQVRNVQVHKFICAGTLEERIDQMLERKSEIAEDIVGTGDGWLTDLSNSDLMKTLRLSESYTKTSR